MIIRSLHAMRPAKAGGKKNKFLILGLICLVALFFFGAIFAVGNSGETGARKQMARDTKKLLDITGSVKSSLNDHDEQPSADRINEYKSKSQQMTGTCNRIINLVGQTESLKYSQDFYDKAKKSKALCNDLSSVNRYTISVYSSLSDYLTHKPAQNDSDTEKIHNFATVITNTQNSFSAVVNNVEDPAYDEIKTQLQKAVASANEVQSIATQEPSQANSALNSLQALASGQQSELWQRRKYFWNNTVRIDLLMKTLESQEKDWR